MASAPQNSERALTPRSTLLDRTSGELIDLTEATTDRLAEVLLTTRELEAELRSAKALVSREVHRRMDREAKWTARVGGYELRGQSPERVEYDPEELGRRLRVLRRSGLVSPAACRNALERVVSARPRKAGIRALLKLGGEVAEAVCACERPVESERRVSVKELRDRKVA